MTPIDQPVLQATSQPVLRGRVLITGANGFTGVYARRELEAAGYQVIGSVASGVVAANEVTLDITSIDACRQVMQSVRPDYVMHLAAISFVQHVNVEAFYRVNVIGTLNLLQAIAEVGLAPRRVLIASSANIYGNATAGMLSEATPPQPVNHYAVSKLAMEHMVRTWNDRLPIVITRPFNYTGVGQLSHFLVPKIVSHFTQHAPAIELGNIEIERDFSDVRMVARVYRALLERDCAGETVNVCSGQAYALRDIILKMQEIAGYRIDVRVNPAFVRQSDVKILIGSPAKLKELIGDVGTITFDETLRWMAST